MRYYLISDDSEALTGMRLAGIAGSLCLTGAEAETEVKKVEEDSGIAVLLITEGCASMIPDTVARLKLQAVRPLIVTIPGSGGTTRSEDSISKLIREAIGIKV